METVQPSCASGSLVIGGIFSHHLLPEPPLFNLSLLPLILHQAQVPPPHRYPCRCLGHYEGHPLKKAFPSLGLESSTAWASPNSEVLQHCSLWWFSTSVVFWFQICFFYHILVWPLYFYFVFVAGTLCSWAYSFLPLM